jgi:hypothetical protein
MTQEALKLALEFIERVNKDGWILADFEPEMYATITAIKEALAQTQEPVAWMYQEYRDDDQFGWRDEILFTPPPNDPIYFRNITPVYTHPPQRTWVGLTRDEQSFVYSNLHNATSRKDSFWVDFANAIEAKLKEKNT